MNIELNESNCSDPDLHGTYDPEEWISVSKNHFGDQFNGLAVLILSEAVKQLNKEKELYTHHGLLIVWSDVEPELVGPFSTAEERDKEAKRIRKENGTDHGIFSVDMECEVGAKCRLNMSSYTSDFMENDVD